LDAVRRWADDEFRSVNSQIEIVLLRALKEAGRQPKEPSAADDSPNQGKATES
jgi:hypothetical protein